MTLFELFRAASGCCDFARSFIVALKKAVGRFKSVVGDCTRRRDNNDRFVRTGIVTVMMMRLSGGVYRARCLRGDVRGVRARRGAAVKAFECKALYAKGLA